jgi:hypothetical protein
MRNTPAACAGVWSPLCGDLNRSSERPQRVEIRLEILPSSFAAFAPFCSKLFPVPFQLRVDGDEVEHVVAGDDSRLEHFHQ